jgi:hypothetical protein
MTQARRQYPWLPVLLAVTWLFWPSGASAAAADSPVSPNAGPVTHLAAPPMPPLKSPVDAFRALLLKSAAEQQKLLAVRPPDARERILKKLQEYRSLTPEERELRLQATELRYYLVPLLSVPATNRAAQLALIPQPTRDLVEARLRYWSLLPPPLREVLLTNQQTVPFLIQPVGTTNASPPSADGVRRRMFDTVERYLELTEKEREKTLSNFPEAEREQMEATLAAFERLTPSQRARCVRSFTKFATMNPEERQDFLKNAERWSQMSLTEREAWRELVSRAPILPPLPYPPMPPQTTLTSRPPAAANGN